MKIYYARPITIYNTPQEKRDIELLEKLGFEVFNPNKEALQKKYKELGMTVFTEIVSECDALAFRTFPDGSISAGCVKEIVVAQEKGIPIIELPSAISKRSLSVDATREYLSNSGQR